MAKLYRRRFIPEETVHLKDDEIIHMADDVIVTRWTVLKPRKDFTHGYSAYFLKEGFKVSRFLGQSGDLVYTYCDIIDTVVNADGDYIFMDMLLDVILYNDGFVRVMDLSEVPEALDKELITVAQAKYAILTLDKLLNVIYASKFDRYTSILDKYMDTAL